MSAPSRLGDLLRVVHALDPDDDELQLIGELLPDHRGTRTGTGRGPARRRGGAAVATASDTRSPPTPPSPTRRAPRKERRSLWDARRALLLPEPGPRERTWWAAIGLLVLLVVGLRATGRLHLGAWPFVLVALAAARPVWWYARLGWQAWWHSPHHLSMIEGTAPEAGGEDDEPDVGSVALTHVRWREPPPGLPLVHPGQHRAVATLLAGRSVPGAIDLVETVRRLASRRPLTPVPLRRHWSTNQGMHLHVDMGPGLDPFRSDIDQLHAALVAVASPYGVVELGFDGDPREITWPPRLVGHGDPLPLADCLPPPGTPVLVVTDLGIAVTRFGSGPEPDELLDHHRDLTRAGCSVHYLVPYPPERWPARLRGLPVVEWSDDLGPGEVLARIRRRVQVR